MIEQITSIETNDEQFKSLVISELESIKASQQLILLTLATLKVDESDGG